MAWRDAPSQTKSFAITVVDPDAPGGRFIHWVLYNIPPGSFEMDQNVPQTPLLPSGAMQGLNDFKTIGYGGPCPPQGEKHAYIFTVYALDQLLPLPGGASFDELQAAMQGHILAESKITGFFAK
jgi:Raf kinase inhibitor-like YbhB/YbcL family protein